MPSQAQPTAAAAAAAVVVAVVVQVVWVAGVIERVGQLETGEAVRAGHRGAEGQAGKTRSCRPTARSHNDSAALH